MSTDSLVQNRYRAIKEAISAFGDRVRGRLYVEHFPVTSAELAEIDRSLNYTLPKEKRAEFGEEKAAKLEEVFGKLRDFKIKERLDSKRLMQLMEIARLLEQDGYHVALEDIDPHAPTDLSEIDRHVLSLPEGAELREGSLLVVYIDPEA